MKISHKGEELLLDPNISIYTVAGIKWQNSGLHSNARASVLGLISSMTLDGRKYIQSVNAARSYVQADFTASILPYI